MNVNNKKSIGNIMKISIFGLGYVGAVSMACLARDGHQVIGVDIDEAKLALLRDGHSPIVEDGIFDLMESVMKSGRVTVSPDANAAIKDSDLSFFCVGTPSKMNGDQDLSAMTQLAEQVGRALASKDTHHTIVVRSTVQPGTIESVITPILVDKSGKTPGDGFSICFQPEFLREGTSIHDYDNPPMTVVGSSDEQAGKKVRELFGHLPCEFIETDIRTAESLKYACNSFHAVKISFANEIGRICQSLGADSQGVMNVLCEDKQLNISRAYLRPGYAFGGSCLPKDLRALLYMAKNNDVDVPMLSSLLPSNRIHMEHALDFLLRNGNRSVGVIGLSFKSGTDDLRESPLVSLVEQLLGKGMQVRIYDPEVQLSRLIGANKRYIDEAIPHIGDLMCDSLAAAVGDAGAVVLGLNDEQLQEELIERNRPEQYVLDLVGMKTPDRIRGEYQGICW